MTYDITETEGVCAEQNEVLRSRSTIPDDFYDYMAIGLTNFSHTLLAIPPFFPSISYQLQNPAAAV